MRADEYAQLPEGDTIDELVAGDVVSEPLRFFRHGRIQVGLASLLLEHVRSRELGGVVTNAGFLLAENPDTVRGPDVAFVRGERYGPKVDTSGYFPGAPDLAVIVSAADRQGEVHARVADFLAAGSKLVWVIDRERRSAFVYRTLLSPRSVPEGGILEGEEVLPGFSVSISDVLAF